MTEEKMTPLPEHENDTVLPSSGAMIGFGVSDDGTMVRINLGAKTEGGSIFVDLPTAMVPGLITGLTQLMAHLVHAGVIPKQETAGMAKGIGQWKVGGSDNPKLKNHTLIVFDEGTPGEVIRFLTDLDALRLAEGIEKKVFTNMSPAEQRRMIEEVQKSSKIIMPYGRRN